MATSNSTLEFSTRKGQPILIDQDDADLADFCWHMNCGYAKRGIYDNGKWVVLLMHRIILGRKLGRVLTVNEFVDHVNGNRSDNRRDNLRLANRQQNCRNAARYKNNQSGYKGVNWSTQRNKWRARIRINGKLITVGFAETAEDAYLLYCEAAKNHFGEFARIEAVSR